MNILFLTKELPYPPDSGSRNRTFHLIKGLAKTYTVTLICFGDKSDKQEGLRPYCSSIECVVPKKQDRSALALLASLFSVQPYSVKSRFDPMMKSKVEDVLKSQAFDLLVCDSIYQALHVPDTGIAKVLNEHNIESAIMRRYAAVKKNPFMKAGVWIEYLKMRRYEDMTWKRFKLCLVCSGTDKQQLHQRAPVPKVEVVSNGVDLEYFKALSAQIKKHSLVYVGQMNWHPNIDAVTYFLKEIYPRLKAAVPDVSLVIVGSHPPEAISKLAEQNHAMATGYVPDTRPFVRQAEVFIAPLRIGGGTRLKILEAMAMGKAVVSTTVGCEGLDVTHEKNILIADNPKNFVESVIKVFNDASLRDKLGKEARQFVEERYSWEGITQELNMVLQREAVHA
jgi:sugar transferase (PEP-CTERM/EpsH1 system associated)